MEQVTDHGGADMAVTRSTDDQGKTVSAERFAIDSSARSIMRPIPNWLGYAFVIAVVGCLITGSALAEIKPATKARVENLQAIIDQSDRLQEIERSITTEIERSDSAQLKALWALRNQIVKELEQRAKAQKCWRAFPDHLPCRDHITR